MEIIKDEIENLKSAWKKTSEQQLFHELESEYGLITTLLSPYSTYHLLKQQEDQEIAIFRSSLLLVAISPPFPYQIKSLAAIQVLSGGNNVVIRP